MHIKRQKSLWILGLGAFAIGIGAYIIAGVLNEIAHGLRIHPAIAGQLITIYSLSYAVFAPISASFASNLNRKTALLIALILFVLGNVISALSDGFFVAALGRVIAAVGASSFTPQASAISTEIVPENKKGYALSVVMGGMSLAMALGIPLGTFIGQWIGWRMVLLGVSGLACVPLLGVFWLFPSLKASGIDPLKKRFSVITDKSIILTFLMTFLATLSEYMVYNYISLILERVFYKGIRILPIALVCFGVGAVLGNALAGYGTDKIGGRRILLFSVVIQSLALLSLVWVYDLPFYACLSLFVWGVTGWMYLVPIQHRLLGLSRQFGVFAISLNHSILYLAIAMASLLGGLFISVWDPRLLGAPAFFIGVLAVTVISFSYKRGR